MKNTIAFRNGFLCLSGGSHDNRQAAMTVASELMQFGFILDEGAMSQMSSASVADITSFYNEIIPFLKKLTGSEHSFRPFWPGFPTQVMGMSECELWFHQMVHYISGGSYSPSEWTKARPTAFEQPSYTVIRAGSEQDMLHTYVSLVSVNNSLTPEDSTYVEWFVNNGYMLPAGTRVPFKETACMLMYRGQLKPKTVTDVLRVAVYMSGGDVSLPALPRKYVKVNAWSSIKRYNTERDAFKFRKFTRAQRRFILGLLEETNCDVRDMKLNAARWVRLAEVLHPGEYSAKYPRSSAMFDAIRNDKVRSWYGEIGPAFDKSYEHGLLKLAERPGEFFRRIDFLVRNASDTQMTIILNVIGKIANGVSNKVLFEVYSHFLSRSNAVTDRRVFVKGARKATRLPDLPAISEMHCDQICATIVKAISTKFASLDKLGRVYIDQKLSDVPVPTNMRSMNMSLKPTIRGTRVPIGNQDAKVIRAYVHWFDERGNVDIDLTAMFLGDNKCTHIGWNGLHSSNIGCYSGDVRNRRGANAEYIDIDVKEALDAGYRYVTIDARNYNGGKLSDIRDCVFGYMEREFPECNMYFVPSTLANTVRLNSPSQNTIVAVIDLETREYIFLDIDQDGIPVASANINSIMDAIMPYMEPPRFSVLDLLNLHSGRFEQVFKEEDADVCFVYDDFVNSYTKTLEYMGV